MSAKMKGEREAFFRAVEAEHDVHLEADAYKVIRVDGRAFHTFTGKMKFAKPYDKDFMRTMDQVAAALCEEIQGAVFAYVQSDEISVLVRPCRELREQMWFGGQLRKWLSVSAGIASGVMSREWETPVVFDSRVLSLAERQNVVRYFLWRQSDCMRNAIQATAQHHIGHKNIFGQDRVLQLRALEAAGVDYNALPQGWRHGRVIMPHTTPMLVAYTHKKTGEKMSAQVERTWWEAQDADMFDWDEAGFLERIIP
jgi:tRNA(His) guanylyltransferase